jgi:Na+/H+ antiporter NhaB
MSESNRAFSDLPPSRPPQDEDRRPLSATFDGLIASNLQLTAGVAKLVRVTYGVLVFNAILVALVMFILWRHP